MIPGGFDAANRGGEGAPPSVSPLFQIWQSVFEVERRKVPSPAPEYRFEPSNVRAEEFTSAPPGGAPAAGGDRTPWRRADGTVVRGEPLSRDSALGQSLLVRLLAYYF